MRNNKDDKIKLSDYLVKNKKLDNSFLFKVDKLINWNKVDYRFNALYPSGEGRPSYPPLAMFKALLVAQWYNLSDPELEEQLNDRLSFRKFIGISLQDDVPDETTICRFRQKLMQSKVGEKVFRIINQQLEAQGLLLKQGTIVDASIIKSSFKGDTDGGWTKKKDTCSFGYKLHAAVEEGNGLIQDLTMTAANVHDSRVFEELLPQGIRRVYADKAYETEERRDRLYRRNIEDRLMYKRVRGQKQLGDAQEYRNKTWSKIRSRVERCFAHLKRIYGFTEVRYVGLKNNLNHMFILATAYNLKRAINLAC
jgi:IS5 family transposase